MGRRGRLHCLHQFDIEATVATVESIYLQALKDLAGTRRSAQVGWP
jgi:hypothetical protein